MLWMAKSKTDSCDAHSTRCTQLLIDIRLAVERKRVIVYFQRPYSTYLSRASKDLGEEPRDFAEVKRHTTG